MLFRSTGALKFTSKTKQSITAKADVVYYDANGKVVDVQETSAYLTSKGKDTKTVTTTKEYSTCKVFKRAYA